MSKILSEEQLWQELAEAVVLMKEEKVGELANLVLENKFSPKKAILNGLTEGMRQVGDKFAQKIYFVPEVLVCADAMYVGFNILKEHVKDDNSHQKASVVIGVIKGDIHDIGKNIVGLMLQTAGFVVHDLGANVPVQTFIKKISEVKPDLIALSTLLSTTLVRMKEIIQTIHADFGNKSPKIMVGGAPVTQQFADEIGADFYGEDAQEAVIGAKQLLGIS
jgi:dimethylamine corrinoid protein